MDFRVLGAIRDTRTIAVGRGIREINRLRKHYGPGRWRKLKGFARVQLIDDTIHTADSLV